MKIARRSKLNLVRRIFFKVRDKKNIYYLLERAYASKNDGYIQVDLIGEETYLKALDREEITEEVEFDDARPNIQYEIRNIA